MTSSRFNVEKIKEASETIKRLATQLSEGTISPSAIIEIATQKLDEVAAELEATEEPGTLWPSEVLQFVNAVRSAGLSSERLERLYQNQLNFAIEAAKGLLEVAKTDEEKAHWQATIEKLTASK
jgi:hypothetical protein